jgi:hypothetical protein
MPTPPNRSFFQAALHEPLLHFVLLGGLVFAAEYSIRSQQDDPRVIVVGPEVLEEARALFRSAKARDPSPAELQILRERWVDNEVLYREGLALRLERGDPTLRERVIFKALNVIESNLRLPEIDEGALRAWFEAHRADYDTQTLYDFSEAVPSDTDPDSAQSFAAALNSGAQTDVQSGLRIFQARPRNTVEPAFGADFTAALDVLPLREWHVLPSSAGQRIVRLESRVAGEQVSFDEVRPRALQDWRDAKAQELRTSAVRELAKKYRVQLAAGSS